LDARRSGAAAGSRLTQTASVSGVRHALSARGRVLTADDRFGLKILRSLRRT